MACESGGDEKIVKYLVKNLTNVDAVDLEGRTPLMLMILDQFSCSKSLEYLLKYSDINTKNRNILSHKFYRQDFWEIICST